VDKSWEQAAAESKEAFESWVKRNEQSVAYHRLNRDGFMEYFKQMVRDGQPFDFWPEEMDRELAALAPAFTPPVPSFVAHMFEHWDDWKREEEGLGLLLVLPVYPNFTHGHEWWKWDEQGVGEPVDRQPGDKWTLWDKQAAQYNPDHPAHGYVLSHGSFCNIEGQHLGWQYASDQNMRLEVNGELLESYDMNPSTEDPWNCLAYDVPFASCAVRMQCRQMFTTGSGMFPEDGEWSLVTRITGAYRLDQIPSVFNTVNSDPQYGKNFSARLDHVTNISPPIKL